MFGIFNVIENSILLLVLYINIHFVLILKTMTLLNVLPYFHIDPYIFKHVLYITMLFENESFISFYSHIWMYVNM